MAARHKRGFWRTCRLYFRRFRITVWIVLLVVALGLAYLHTFGLPALLKKPLQRELKARGIEFNFARLRLRWFEGIIADQVRFCSAEDPNSPQLTAREVQVPLNVRALLHGKLQIDALQISRGRLVLPVLETNRPQREITVEDIRTDLRFLPGDQWSLEHLHAQFAGARIELSGIVTNASAVRDWATPKPGAKPTPGLWQRRVRWLADTLEQIKFSTEPSLQLNIAGDALDLGSFRVELAVTAPDARTPWGTFEEGKLTTRLYQDSNHVSQAELHLESARAQTRWGSAVGSSLEARLHPAHTNISHAEVTIVAREAQSRWSCVTNLHLRVQLDAPPAETNRVHGELSLLAGQFTTAQWAGGKDLQLQASWTQFLSNAGPILILASPPWDRALTNASDLSGTLELQCHDASSPWARAETLKLSGRVGTPGTDLPAGPAAAALSWWTNLYPWLLSWESQMSNVQTSKLLLNQVACAGSWRGPELVVTNFQARVGRGEFAIQSSLNVSNRELHFNASSSLDPHDFSELLPTPIQRELAEFQWRRAPELSATGRARVPAWTNREPDWLAELRSALEAAGELKLPEGIQGHSVAVDELRSHFTYSNLTLNLPDFTLVRPDGRLDAAFVSSDRTHEFSCKFQSTIDPSCVRPLLPPEAQKAFELVSLSTPPSIAGELSGQWNDASKFAASAKVAITNFSFRGEAAATVQTRFAYADGMLHVYEPRVERGNTHMSADGVMADFKAQMVYLTNGVSDADPMFVARCIGPHIARIIEAYQFLKPPKAHVWGAIPLRGEAGADLHVELDGGPFHWWKFTVPHLSGLVHWEGEHLSLSNLVVDFYEGKATADAAFDFIPNNGADFTFTATTTNSRIHTLIGDFSNRTNSLEGRLSGTVVVTKANTLDWRSVNGHGDFKLRDGLIWDLPLFGAFSDVLNSMSPGLGSVKVTDSTCTYIITNGIVRSDNLDMRSMALRLEYRGSVDLEGHTDAKVKAELLRDMWLVGPVVSTMFWPMTKLFEYKVSGTLEAPKIEPVYFIPKLMVMPFHPIRAIKNLFQDNSTNAPPKNGSP